VTSDRVVSGPLTRLPPALSGLAVVMAAMVASAPSARSTPAFAQSPPATRVLFVGNSLTFANNLPDLVAALARAEGRAVVVQSVAFPDVSLEDHWARGDAARAIARGGWQWVVLQQGPSALAASRVSLVEYVGRFNRLIRDAGARTAVYMVWPSSARRGDFDGVSRSYRAAAEDAGAVLLPAGDAWRAAWTIDASLPLYGTDGFHPSRAGTALAAIVIYEGLFDRPAPDVAIPGVPAAQLVILRRAAAEVRAGRRLPLTASSPR
jgi:hypothetical protein